MEDVFGLLSVDIDKSKTLNKNKEIKKGLAKKFDCSDKEIEILSFMTNKYISGKTELVVIDIFNEIYKVKEEDKSLIYLEKINYIKNLLSLGWINLSMEILLNEGDIKDLELLQCSIEISYSMLYLLQNGKKETDNILRSNEYKSNIDYLTDKFLMIDTYEQYALNKNNNYSSATIKDKLDTINQKINSKIKNSKIKLDFEIFFNKHKLIKNEIYIFFYLLKSEYFPFKNKPNDLESILSLISSSEKAYLNNKKLLIEKSTLIKNNIVSKFKNFEFQSSSNFFEIHEDLLEQIDEWLYNLKDTKTASNIDKNIKDDGFFSLVNSDIMLKDVVLEPKLKEQIEKLIQRSDKDVIKKLKEWQIDGFDKVGLKVIFHGSSGTGKTICAKALANELKQKLITLDCSKILDMYHGESEKNVRKIFDKVEEIEENLGYKPILMLDEADQFLSTRSKYSSNMNNNIQNIFLQQIEAYNGIIIATTNFLDLIDKAFSRRFDYRLKFKRPDFDNRVKLWKMKLPKAKLNIDIKELAKYDLSGAQIDIIVRNTCFEVALKEKSIFNMQDFIHFIDIEIKSSLSKKSIGFN
jgi:SpoVK/Ycf46/Vps4 family AAA+-type ATPase